MKRGLLLVDHGSRAAEANAVLDAFAAALVARDPETPVRVAHMELAPPTVEDAFSDLVACGVDEIVVYPHFIAPGRHSRVDIPALAERAAAPYPGLRVRLAQPLGTHPGLVEVVLERVAQASPLHGPR